MKFPTSLGVVALVAASLGTSAVALSLSQAATPAETPPASYSKDVYVDSRGCVYVRASIGTSVNWVPRLSHDRETVVCGMTPSASVAAVAPPPAPPAPPPPAATTPTLSAARPAPVSDPDPYGATAVSMATGAGGVSRTMEVTCPADGAVTRVQIGGDTVAVSCPRGMNRTTSYIVTHSDGSRSRLVAHPATGGTGTPGTAFGSGYGLTASAPPFDPVPTPGYVTRPARQVQPPAGYKPAWDDDRLNPYRGPRTPYGDAQMSTLLDTSKVPMPAADPVPVRTMARTVVISKSQTGAATPVAPTVAASARFVQVGAFGVSGNANRTVARLQDLGFTAATSRTGSGLTLVMAGPFSNPAELARALQTLRGYYPDAYPRG